MQKPKKYQFCLISHDLQQAAIIKNIVNELYPENNEFFVIGDTSSVKNIKNHIFFVDYKTIVTQEVTEIDTSVNHNAWFVINIDKTCLLSSAFWIDNGFCGALYEKQTIVNLASAIKCFLDRNEYWYTRKELTDAVKLHHQQDIPHSTIAELIANQYNLTPKEKDILLHMLDGFSNQQIAQKNFISVHTVKNHVAHIMSKMGVTSRKELLAVNFC